MNILTKLLGPKSKYDHSLPYTYEARVRIFEDSGEFNSYFSDTVCGLVEHLQRNSICPDKAEIFEIYLERESLIDRCCFTAPDAQWLAKPDICRAFSEHYKGHIRENACSFKDRDKRGSGP